MLTQDRSEKEQDEYLRKLRQEAFIKPAPNYGEVIQPLLDKDKSWQQTAATHHPAIWQRSGYVVADWINSIQTRSRFLSVRTLG